MSGEPVSSEHIDVAAYALDLLELEDRRAFEAHLAGCPDCRQELAEFSGMKDLLTGIGPIPSETEEPTEAEVVDLVQRRAAGQRRQRRRTRWRVALGAVAVAAALVGAVFLGQVTASQSVFPPGSTIISATSRVTHVKGTAGLLPKTWGTLVTVELSHVAGPLECQIVAVSRTGERQVLSNWLVPPHARFGLPGHPNPLVIGGLSGIKINDLSHIDINVVNGPTLVSIPVSHAAVT